MSNIDEICGYFKMLEGNMEKREHLISQGGFKCGTCIDKDLTEEDIKALKDKIASFKEKSNKLAEVFNELFETKFIPYPKEEVKEDTQIEE